MILQTFIIVSREDYETGGVYDGIRINVVGSVNAAGDVVILDAWDETPGHHACCWVSSPQDLTSSERDQAMDALFEEEARALAQETFAATPQDRSGGRRPASGAVAAKTVNLTS